MRSGNRQSACECSLHAYAVNVAPARAHLAMLFFASAFFCALLACACSGVNDPSESAKKSISADTSADAFSFSQKKLLDIIREQERFIGRVKEHSNMPRHDVLTTANRINSLWNGYLGDNPEDAEALVIYSKFLRFIGDRERSYSTAKKADSINPNMPSAKECMAAYEAESGMYKDAYGNICKAIGLNPKISVYYRQKAQIIMVYRARMISAKFADRERLDAELLECYRKVCELEPKNARAKWQYAQAFYELQKADWNAALELWDEIEKESALNLDLQTARANKARVLVELGRDSEAEKLLSGIDLPALQNAKSMLLGEIERAKKESLQEPGVSASLLKNSKKNGKNNGGF